MDLPIRFVERTPQPTGSGALFSNFPRELSLSCLRREVSPDTSYVRGEISLGASVGSFSPFLDSARGEISPAASVGSSP